MINSNIKPSSVLSRARTIAAASDNGVGTTMIKIGDHEVFVTYRMADHTYDIGTAAVCSAKGKRGAVLPVLTALMEARPA